MAGFLTAIKPYSESTNAPTTPSGGGNGSTRPGSAPPGEAVDGITIERDGLGRLRLVIPLDITYDPGTGGTVIRVEDTSAAGGYAITAESDHGVALQGASVDATGVLASTSTGAGIYAINYDASAGQAILTLARHLAARFELQTVLGVLLGYVEIMKSSGAHLKVRDGDDTTGTTLLDLTAARMAMAVPVQPQFQQATGPITVAVTTSFVPIVAAFTGAITLPAAGLYPKFAELIVKDISMFLTGTGSTVTVTPAGTDSIQGGNPALSTNGAFVRLVSDGIATWYRI